MRRVRRDMAGGGEIAMMAVITKAMGAFLVIMLFLLPYYQSNPETEKTAEETTEQVEQVKREVQYAQIRLKTGILSQEEIDELIRRLNVALALLEQALLNIRQLKIENDQLASQVNRLTQEVAALQRDNEALRREIEQLKDEIERLKRNQGVPPQSFWNTVRLEWSGCPGAELNLYGASNQPGEDKKLSPPPDRTIQQPFFKHDLYLGKGLSGGDTTWVLDRLRPDELITFYVKYLNALPGGPVECTLSARWNHLPKGDEPLRNAARGTISEQQPYLILVRLKADERGSLSPEPVSDSEAQAFLKEIAASPCEGMACGLGDATAKPLFVDAIVERFIGRLVPASLATVRLGSPTGPTERQRGETVLKALGERYASKQISYADIGRWVGVLVEPMRDRVQRTVPAALRDLWAFQLGEAGAPDQVVDMFRVRVSNSRFDPDALPTIFEKAGVTRAPRPLSGDPAREAFALVGPWTEQGVDARLAITLARLVVEGRLKLDAAKELAALIIRHRDRLPESYKRTPAGEDLQARLDSLHPTNSDVHRVLDPAWTKVPPAESLPLVKQITLR